MLMPSKSSLLKYGWKCSGVEGSGSGVEGSEASTSESEGSRGVIQVEFILKKRRNRLRLRDITRTFNNVLLFMFFILKLVKM